MSPPRQSSAQTGATASDQRKADISGISLSQDRVAVVANDEYFPAQVTPLSPGYLSDAQSLNSQPGSHFETQTVLAAFQYLPVPVLVLSSQKTVVIANEAFGRLLDIDLAKISEDDANMFSASDVLKGQTMGQLGVDILKDGSPIWVSWDVRFTYSLLHRLTYNMRRS